MSTYVMSDIHGCYDQFMEMLETIDFKPTDTMYICGDIIDRGNQNLKMVEFVKNTKNIIMLMGNHEKMFLDCYKVTKQGIEIEGGNLYTYLGNGGGETRRELEQLPQKEFIEVYKWVEKLPYYKFVRVNGMKFLLVHGGVPMGVNQITEDIFDDLLWERPSINIGVELDMFEGHTVIFGHTPTQFYHDSNEIYYNRDMNFYCIDGAGVYGGMFTCLRLEDLEEFYIINNKIERKIVNE